MEKRFKMIKIAKVIWSVLDGVYGAFWSLTITDYFFGYIDGVKIFDNVERWAQLLVMLSPVLYIWLRHISKRPLRKEEARRAKLENDYKEEELKKLKKQNNE